MQDHKASWTYGLERRTDLRETFTGGLEVAKNEQEKGPQVDVYTLPPLVPPKSVSARYIHHELESPRQDAPASRTCGLRRSRFWFFAVLTALAVALIVAASVAGTLISQQKHASAHQEDNQAPLAASSTNTTSQTHTTPSTASLPTSSAAFINPTSDCSSLQQNATYILSANPASSLPRSVNFSIQCNSDYKLPLVMAMRTYRFEDCMQACATHATNSQDPATACTVAVYKPNSQQSITCWLKSQGDEDSPVHNVGVDSARIVG
ncbi:MAG: hypothetical protein Q9218_006381 [Villophora microphyllina]